jgi:hypothetical protein
MSLTGIVEGDIVECDIRGDVFYGHVTERVKGQITVTPIGVRAKYPRIVKASQVKARYRRCKS